MAIALLAMFAQMERIYMLERAAGARAAKQARGLPTGRPAKLNATTRAGAGAAQLKDGAVPEQVAADLGISRSTLYRELRKHRADSHGATFMWTSQASGCAASPGRTCASAWEGVRIMGAPSAAS